MRRNLPAGCTPFFLQRGVLLSLAATLIGACSKSGPPPSADDLRPTPEPARSSARALPPPPDASPAGELSAPAPRPDAPLDPAEIERHFFAAADDPEGRIAAIHELANASPAVALDSLNRLFSVERREDVKSAMLEVLKDLDHAGEPDQQLAFCVRAAASTQPHLIRYLAINTMADLHDTRARSILIGLQGDPDRELRAAATQALSDLRR